MNTMLCDVIIAVTEFMLGLEHDFTNSRNTLLEITMSVGLKPGHACDVISAVAEFMVAGA